ncbi:hypothetical protein [uncultured Sphingomonas sp.]|uniref:head-tail connector protein n=1 Tax=uncultured Sphingomonas sp. TaxID=158754 RepID=UPI0025FCBACE|nr:hypothetical protein [uncultured Sphingomonas sp.]
MTPDEMRAQLGLGPEVSDAEVVDRWAQLQAGVSVEQVPPDEPVTLAEARTQLGMLPGDDATQDRLIEQMICAARQMIEGETGMVLARRVITVGAASFWGLKLAERPIISIDAISYTDLTGAAQDLDASAWRAIVSRGTARVVPAGSGLPSVYPCGRDAITITATAGYTPDDVPDTLKRAILILVTSWFVTRGEWKMSEGVRSLCELHERW